MILNNITIEPKSNPKFYQLRTWIAFALVRLAKRIKPGNDAVNSFWLQEMINDSIINGTGFVNVKPNEIWGKNPIINLDE